MKCFRFSKDNDKYIADVEFNGYNFTIPFLWNNDNIDFDYLWNEVNQDVQLNYYLENITPLNADYQTVVIVYESTKEQFKNKLVPFLENEFSKLNLSCL